MTVVHPPITSVARPGMEAVIVAREPLVYQEGPSEQEDRPAHVRAASAARFATGKLFVVQDDANFIGVRAGDDGTVRAITLPRGADGRRRFEKGLGNKPHKLDLEAAVLLEGPTLTGRTDPRLVAFGSGSTPAREHIVQVDIHSGAVELVDAASLYAMFRHHTAFCGSELNIEGAVVDAERLVLFQRANGAPREGLEPVNATMEIELGAFLRWLEHHASVPEPVAIQPYDLGAIGGVPYGFTDAALLPTGPIVFLAGAEDSPDTYRDGEVLGSRVGLLEDGLASHTTLVDERGAPTALKVEGIAVDLSRPAHAWVVTDVDDPHAAALLCEVELRGFADD